MPVGRTCSRGRPPGKHVAELKGSDTVAGDAFGDSVSISDATVVVGAPYYANQAGRAYVFTKTTAGWRQTAELTGSDTVAGDQFGWSVVMSGTIAIGAPFHANQAGRAYLFMKTTAGWKQAIELKGSDTVAGDDFGLSLTVSSATPP